VSVGLPTHLGPLPLLAAVAISDKRARNMQNTKSMELLGRIAAAMGISLVLTILMMALYQDDAPGRSAQAQLEPSTIADSR
jgi:hypothetical protein